MPNNFKLSGTAYVSIAGSDANDGLTPNTPKRTINAGLALFSNPNLVIGAGVYCESINRVVQSGTISGDGLVIISGVGNRSWFLNTSGTTVLTLNNLIFRDWLDGTSLGLTNQNTFNNCKFINTIIQDSFGSSGGPTMNFINCICINSQFNNRDFGTGANRSNKSIFINCKSTAAFLQFDNSYADGSSVIRMGSGTTSMNVNNIQGIILPQFASTVTSGIVQDTLGYYYNLSLAGTGGDGSISNPYYRANTSGRPFDLANFKILFPTINTLSFSANPLFNNAKMMDFSLQSSSPMIAKCLDGTNIGGTLKMTRIDANGNEFNASAISISGLTLNGKSFVATGTNGEVISYPILFNSTPKVIQSILYSGNLRFDRSLTPPAPENNNVPDQLIYIAGQAGIMPERLVYYMRISTKNTIPLVDADWDNNNSWTAGDYQLFEWNTKPSVDSAGIGNGDPSFAGVTTYLNAKWIQLKVKLRNDFI